MVLNEKKKLETLKTIAETLNQSQDKQHMLQSVLKELIDITHFETGWIFLQNDQMVLMADEGLPPALTRDNKRPMCGEEYCYCVSRYNKGTLTKATAIIECKRLEDAISEGKYDTCGLTHHATVPLKTPDKMYGLLNVGAPGRTPYGEDELNLLESVALQIGTALKRLEQFEKEEERSRLLETLNTFVRELRNERNMCCYVESSGEYFKNMFYLDYIHISLQEEMYEVGKPASDYRETFTFKKVKGKLSLNRKKPLNPVEKEVMQFAVQHLELAYRDLMLQEKEKDVARIEERNRLAQDLHDSVNQLLFSIMLTAKAAKQNNQDPNLEAPLTDLADLSSQALREMRTLIAKKKAAELEKGLLTGLARYAERLHLKPETESEGSISIPYHIEETLLRIGQEAIHNVNKHANTDQVYLTLKRKERGYWLTIKDNGVGFNVEKYKDFHSFGLKGMTERAAVYNGKVTIESKPSQGTTITVFIPDGGEKE